MISYYYSTLQKQYVNYTSNEYLLKIHVSGWAASEPMTLVLKCFMIHILLAVLVVAVAMAELNDFMLGYDN